MIAGKNLETLNIVMALHCEAKPIINHFKLKKITQIKLPFPIYVNTAKTIFLTISGVGKIKAAIATSWLHFFTEQSVTACYLNVGIAGSISENMGNLILANKITDQATNRSWYPYIFPSFKELSQAHLTTHDQPQFAYPDRGMVDMEGSAFFQAANYFVTQEQIQILKVISDNSLDSQNQLNAMTVSDLISQQIYSISSTMEHLLYLSRQELAAQTNSMNIESFFKTWHFTHSQRLQLQELLRRWSRQVPDQDAYEFCRHELNAHTVMDKIDSKLNDYANNLY